MKRREPHTPAEWQEAVDGAAACRIIADCMMYGLLEGDLSIDVPRCDYILENGRKLGITPSKPVTDLALGFIAAHNEQAGER